MAEVTLGSGKNPIRLAFTTLHTPEKYQGQGEPAYSCSFILDPTAHAETVQAVEAAIQAVATEKWGAKAKAILANLDGKSMAYHKKPKTNANGDVYVGYEGMYHIDGRNGGKPGQPALKPTLVDRDRTPLGPESGKPYGGCYAIAKVDIWAQDNAYGKGIRCTIKGIQFVKDGPAFSGASAARADEFEELEAEEEEFFA
jgi:hypothetical protein